MNSHRFILEPYKGLSSRHFCPNCNKGKTFSLYLDRETNQPISPLVGRCNRESNCEYHYTPKRYFQDNNIQFEHKDPITAKKQNTKAEAPLRQLSTIPVALMKSSLAGHDANNFAIYLCALFGPEVASELIARYFIGTSKYWPGATVFWQIDAHGKVRTGKIMLYDPCTGKRVKEPHNHITWAHKVASVADYNLQQCLFGEHLLSKEPSKPVAIVESEKTAIIASAFFPQFVWLACGSLTNLSRTNCAVLQGRNVTLYPDINGFEKWQKKAAELSNITNFGVSDLLEVKATPSERLQGLDLADYLVKNDFKVFLNTFKEGAITLNIEDVIDTLGETRTGKEFGYIRIAGVKVKGNIIYDMLFKLDDEPVETNEMKEEVLRLANHYEKQLFPLIFNGRQCWASLYKGHRS